MAKNVQFKLNLKGLNELMKSEWMQGCLTEAGEAVANACGSDYEAKTKVLNFVAVSNVNPMTESAYRENYKDNTMIKALSAVGLRMEKS